MSRIKAFLDTNVLLSAFGTMRNGGSSSYLITTKRAERMTFEKCIFECFLAFRGIGGKKPDEGRQDWAARFLKKENDPFTLGDSTGKLHQGSLLYAHYWVGQAEEAMYAFPESFEEYMADVRRIVRREDWAEAEKDWIRFQSVFKNHQKYQCLFEEFRTFLSEYTISVIGYEHLYQQERQLSRMEIMDGLSQRSTIPSEDFEIVVAAMLSEPDVFVSTDKRLLTATASIEANLRRCDFVHLEDVRSYVETFSEG